MAFFDKSLDELRRYRPAREEPDDFDAFWQTTLAESPVDSSVLACEPFETPLATVEAFDVTFSGWLGQPIKAWLLLPRHRTGPLPTVVQYLGYKAGRSVPWNWLTWTAFGFAHVVMDNRGQGGGGKTTGITPDINPFGHGASAPGFLTSGVEDPTRYYFRRLITDAVRAVDAVKLLPAVDRDRVAVLGGSQGGGLALSVAGLRDDVAGMIADVPCLCHYRRGSQITDQGPYAEISRFLMSHRFEVEPVMRTLSYFDGVNFAARARCPGWFSVGLMDKICPPSTVFAAYHAYAGPSQIEVFTYNGHEGGAQYDVPRKLGALQEVLGVQG
ncbi:cephalosporin-C deacetylase [Brooklawnia cerclae]|uniref:Cephalosporin-C deacetylase n=1 Tax=Brooklawnia cerclae TaxID=349934 RepID=A0ABX0SNI3_9ACTN|nr:acetylxylan esterase [Brooklawnia cerclae]NIH58605.1 cephalosporin-C deacetylase [Brooklawnia cerclae]